MQYTNVQQYGNNILFIGYDDNGDRIQEKLEYSPTLYVKSQKGPTGFKGLYGEDLEQLQFADLRDAKDFIARYKGVNGFEVHGQTNFVYQFISDSWPDDISYNFEQIRKANIDIEVHSEEGFPEPKEAAYPINAITHYDSKRDTYFVWATKFAGLKDYERNLHKQTVNIEYRLCQDEFSLLLEYLAFWKANTPDIVTGWNIRFFDIPYIINRYRRLFDDKKAKEFSPWNQVREKNVEMHGKMNQTYDIIGLTVADYIELYKKYTYSKQESYKLGYIAHVELGETKEQYDGTLANLAMTDHQKFIEYNIKDVILVQRLDNKMQLLSLIAEMAYMSKVNYLDVYGPVKLWEVIIYNHLLKKNIIIPPKADYSDKDEKYAGAYVKDPIIGMHNWVVSFDLNSLYPSIVRQWNISPETWVSPFNVPRQVYNDLQGFSVNQFISETRVNGMSPGDILRTSNLTMSANKQFFKTDARGCLPEIFANLYDDRSKTKKTMIAKKKEQETTGKDLSNEIAALNNRQMALKILLNSAYGAIGNPFFAYYSIEKAEAITVTGQVVIQWIETRMNAYLNKTLGTTGVNYVIASDTDSIYVVLDGLVKKLMPGETDTNKIVDFIDNSCKKVLEPFITSKYADLANYFNVFENQMVMKRECISQRGIWRGKKNYALTVWDDEGVRLKEPKIKITGIEAVRSSTPEVCRKKIKECLKVILTKNEDDVIKFIEDFRSEWKSLRPDEVAFPRGTNDFSSYRGTESLYNKGTPIHVKASLLYNKKVEELNLKNKYPLIQEGENIKFTYLKIPNPLGDSVVAMQEILPPEFELDKYVDYDVQFEKAFLEPIKSITDVIGWKTEHVATLEDFF